MGLELGLHSPREALQAYLQDRQLLLVLDNTEHLPQAAEIVAELLTAARGLTVVATGRSPLRLRGEHEFPLNSLELPSPGQYREQIACAQAVELFVQRARAVWPGFSLSPENAEDVAEICRRLDGLPLAIELAAARIRLLSPKEMRMRLNRRLSLLTDGARDLPARQRTLRATLDWSYALLEDYERTLLAYLSVFWGGWTLEAAEAVCGRDVDVLGGMASLVEKNLVERTGEEEVRFSMLETVREYALEKLEASGKAGELRDRHEKYFLRLAEASEPGQRGSEQIYWFKRLGAEQPNFLAALRHSLDCKSVVATTTLFRCLIYFWQVRGDDSAYGLLIEAGARFQGAERGVALIGKIMLDSRRGEVQAQECEQALALLRGHPFEGYALFYLGLSLRLVDPPAALACLEAAAGLSPQGKGWVAANARQVEAWLRASEGDLLGAEAACAAVAEYADLAQDFALMGWNRACRAALFLEQKRLEAARTLAEEALTLGLQIQDRTILAGGLELFAALAAAEHHDIKAARLWGAVAALRHQVGMEKTLEVATLGRLRAALPQRMGQAAFEAECRRGEAMPLEMVMEYMRSAVSAPPPWPRNPLTNITPRETEVLRALSQGLSNKEIARELGLSLYTINDHVKSILSKLGVTNRAAATRYALENLSP